MNLHKKHIVCMVMLSVTLVAAVVCFFSFARENEYVEDCEAVSYAVPDKPSVPPKRESPRTRIQHHPIPPQSQQPKPSIMELEEDEEAKLNEFSRKILLELQEALDSEDFGRVQKLVAKMLEIPPDPKFGADGVATLLRRKAVEAMGWFGSDGLPELVGLLADKDQEVSDAAFDQFTLALEDISLSDSERASIVSMAAKVLTDVDNLEALFMEINNMRHSVGVTLLKEICLNGTDAAKSLMKEQIEFFTGEDNIVTVKDLENWLQNNPDGPDDDDLYGGDD